METIKEKQNRWRKTREDKMKSQGKWKAHLKKRSNSQRRRYSSKQHISQLTLDYCSKEVNKNE